jgi:L-glutamine-phosphate cytidylyltransferase
LQNLRIAGIHEVGIVVGYEKEQIMHHVFSAEVNLQLFDKLGKLVSTGRVNEFFNVAIQQLADESVHVGFTSTGGLPWAEIDDPADLAFARQHVFPKLARAA